MFRSHPQSAIMGFMRFVPIVSIILSYLALNAQTIQGKVVRVVDGDTITIRDEVKVQGKTLVNRIDAPEPCRIASLLEKSRRRKRNEQDV